MAQLSFDEIKSQHALAQSKGLSLGQMPLKDFAATMQQHDQDNDWSQGSLPDNFVTGISRGIDKGFAATGLPEITGSVGASFGGLVDSVRGDGNDQKYTDIGRSVGESIPRAAAGIGLAFGGAALAPASGGGSLAAWAPAASLIGLGAADAGIKGYSDTGSVGAGVMSAATTALAPGISAVGSKVGLGALGKFAPAMSESSPVARFIASEIGQEATFFGTGVAQNAVQTGSLSEALSPENLFAEAVGTAAFAPFSIAGAVEAGRVKRSTNIEISKDADGNLIPRVDVPVNNDARLFDYITGKKDDELKEMLKSGNMKQALELTGLLDPDLSNGFETLNRREAGKKVAQRLLSADETSLPENRLQPNVREAAQQERIAQKKILFDKAVKLLQSSDVDFGEMITRIGLNNYFAKNTDVSISPEFPLSTFVNNPSLKPSFDDYQNFQQRNTKIVKGAEEAKTLEAFDRNAISEENRASYNSLPNRRVREMEDEARKYGNPYVNPDGAKTPVDYEQPVGLRPGAVRGRVNRDPGATVMNPPDIARAEMSRAPEEYKTPIGATPTYVRGRPSDLESRIKAPEWSKVDNALFDEKGEITSTTLDAKFKENLDLEGDPDRAMARTDAQVRGALMSKMKDTRPDVFVRDGLGVASRAFDEMGLDKGLKDGWLEGSYRLLDSLSKLEGTNVKTLDDLVIAGVISHMEVDRSYGLFYGPKNVIGLNTANKQATPELGLFHFTKTLGHEAFHALSSKAADDAYFGIDNERVQAYSKAVAFSDSLDVGTREGLLRDLQAAVIPDAHRTADLANANRLGTTAKLASISSDEFMAEYAGLLSTGLTRAESTTKVQDLLRWAPQAIQDFARGLFRTMSEIKAMTLRTAEFLGFSKSQVQELNQFQENLKLLLTPDPVVAKAKQDVLNMVQPFRVLNGELDIRDLQWSKVDSSALEEAVEKVRKTNWFENHILNLQQTSNSQRIQHFIPNSPRVMNYLTTLGAKIATINQSLRSETMVIADGGLIHELATMSDKDLTPELIQRKSNIAKVNRSAELKVKLSEIYIKMNDLQESTNDPITFDHPEFQNMVKDLKEEDRSAMRAVFNAQLKENDNARNLIRADKVEQLIHVARQTYREVGLADDDANKTARIVMNELVAGKPLPPELNAIAGTDKVANFWEGVRPVFEETMSKYEGLHASELRIGKWFIKFEKENSETGTIAVEDGEKRAMENFLKKRGDKITLIENRENREFTDTDFMSAKLLESLIAMDRAKYESALANLDPAVAEQMRNEFSVGQGIREELGKRKQFEAARKLKPGRELIDMHYNQSAYIEVVAATMAKRMARREVEWEMGSKNWDYDLDHKAEMQEHAKSVLTTRNPSAAAQAVMQATSFVTMGANVSGAFTDASQPLTMGWWNVARTLGPVEAAKAVFGGYPELVAKKDFEFQKILTRATNEKYFFGATSLQNDIPINDSAGHNVGRVGQQRSLIPLSEQLTKHDFVAGLVMGKIRDFAKVTHETALIPMSLSSQLNQKIMLRAGMIEGQKLNLKDDALYQHAINVMQVSNAAGGRAAHGAFKHDFGKMNNWVMVATQLTNYPLSMMSSIYQNYRDALKSSGLPLAKRRKAQQVFAGQLTMQFGLAGVLGLGAGTLFKLTEQIFGFSPEEEVRKGLAELDASGNLADILLSGVANKATGLDFASRFSLGGVMGLNDYSGFDAKGLIGPSATLWGGIAKLPMDIMEGNVDKSTLLPNGIRKMIEATSSGPFKDRNGQALIEPTTTERVAKFIGFNSDRVSKLRKQRDLYKFADESTQRENSNKTNEQIKLLGEGDFASVLQSIQVGLNDDVMSWKAQGVSPLEIKKLIDKETRARALKLVNSAVQKTFPLDPLAGGDTASAFRRQRIAAGFGNGQAPRETDAQRAQLAARLLQGLGQAAVARSPRSIRISQLTQRIIEEDPTITEQQARMLAEQSIQ